MNYEFGNKRPGEYAKNNQNYDNQNNNNYNNKNKYDNQNNNNYNKQPINYKQRNYQNYFLNQVYILIFHNFWLFNISKAISFDFNWFISNWWFLIDSLWLFISLKTCFNLFSKVSFSDLILQIFFYILLLSFTFFIKILFLIFYF